MGTIVTYPREKHADGKQFNFRNVKTDLDRAIMARILLENVRKWVADPTRDAIFNMDLDMGEPGDPELTSEQIEEMDKAVSYWGTIHRSISSKVVWSRLYVRMVSWLVILVPVPPLEGNH